MRHNALQWQIAGVALGLFILTLIFTPWQYDGPYFSPSQYDGPFGSKYAIAPVWSPPEDSTVEGNVMLRVDCLVLEWACIGAICLGLARLATPRSQSPRWGFTSRRRQRSSWRATAGTP